MSTALPFSPTPLLETHFDHELAQLELGLRRVIKREFCRAGEQEKMRARGWAVVRIDGGYHVGARSALRQRRLRALPPRQRSPKIRRP